jgi:hypothetical protein
MSTVQGATQQLTAPSGAAWFSFVLLFFFPKEKQGRTFPKSSTPSYTEALKKNYFRELLPS